MSICRCGAAVDVKPTCAFVGIAVIVCSYLAQTQSPYRNRATWPGSDAGFSEPRKCQQDAHHTLRGYHDDATLDSCRAQWDVVVRQR